PTRGGSSRWTWRVRSGTSRATSRSICVSSSTWAATRGSSPRPPSSGDARAPRTRRRGWPASTAGSRGSRATSSTSSFISRGSSATRSSSAPSSSSSPTRSPTCGWDPSGSRSSPRGIPSAVGKRLPELRAHGQVSEAASDRVVAFMDALEEPEAPQQTVERLVGVYRVLKPHLLASYHDHLVRANPVYEPPTRRILVGCIDDERRHIAAGETILGHLCVTPALTERAGAWQRRLEELLTAA